MKPVITTVLRVSFNWSSRGQSGRTRMRQRGNLLSPETAIGNFAGFHCHGEIDVTVELVQPKQDRIECAAWQN